MAQNADYTINDVSLNELASSPGPFTTLYVSAGDSGVSRARLAIDRSVRTIPAAEELLEWVDDVSADTQVIVRGGTGRIARFRTTEPLRSDVARQGPYVALGTLLEAHQLTTPHAVVTVEDDVYAITTFGNVAVPDAELSPTITESAVHAIESLRFGGPSMIALAGRRAEIEAVAPMFRDAFPLASVLEYPSTDLDAELGSLSDSIVRDATSKASEHLTHELASFRAARETGIVAEDAAAVRAIADGLAGSVLVHDDPDDGRILGDGRLIDAAVHAALATSTRIVMIPSVPAESGPAGGVGAILENDAADPVVGEPSGPGDLEAVSPVGS